MTTTLRMTAVVLIALTLTTVAFAQKEQNQTPAAEMARRPATTDPTYIIGAEDVLQVNVWHENELSGTFPVRPDGKITLPLVDDIQAAGLTPMQLSGEIAGKLNKFVESPRVTVAVMAINSRRVYLMGQVGRPGAFPLQGNMTVLQAISLAGGLAQFANAKKVYILRNENGQQVRLPFNYKDVIKGKRPEQNIALQPGDTIVVP
jgi:polysaccharide export outer membrane protein